jgi:hypothetical protein
LFFSNLNFVALDRRETVSGRSRKQLIAISSCHAKKSSTKFCQKVSG